MIIGKWLRYHSETYFAFREEEGLIRAVKLTNGKTLGFTKENMVGTGVFERIDDIYEKVLIKAIFKDITSSSEW